MKTIKGSGFGILVLAVVVSASQIADCQYPVALPMDHRFAQTTVRFVANLSEFENFFAFHCCLS